MTIALGIILLIIASLTLMGAGATAYQVGVPRKPLTEAQAGARILLGIFYVVVFIWAGILLMVVR